MTPSPRAGNRRHLLRRGLCLPGLLLCATACSAQEGPASDADAAATATEATAYSSHHFKIPLTVRPPAWRPGPPTTDEPRFLTWVGEGADIHRAVRFLLPVGIYEPPTESRLSPVPTDYVAYLRGLTRYGASFSAWTSTTVAGYPATLVTARSTAELDGSLGCPEKDLAPWECFGFQEFMVLRLAVIDAGDETLLAWARTDPSSETAEDDFKDFEATLSEAQVGQHDSRTLVREGRSRSARAAGVKMRRPPVRQPVRVLPILCPEGLVRRVAGGRLFDAVISAGKEAEGVRGPRPGQG